jgi:hypothetical protein
LTMPSDLHRSSQPLGVIPGATTGVTTASNSAITWVEIVKLWGSVNAVYRANGTWMMNTATAATLNELEDSAGKPLFNPAFGPMQILGRPVVINDQFPNIGSATSPIVSATGSVDISSVPQVSLVFRWLNGLQTHCCPRCSSMNVSMGVSRMVSR